MNPFDVPPSGDPVAAPAPSAHRPRRARMAIVAVLTAGLIGGGIAGISQFASADRPDLAATATGEPSDETVPPVDESSEEDTGDAPAQPAEPDAEERDGEIVLDTGDGDPIVIDLGEIGAADVARLTECIGLPDFGEFDHGRWEAGDLPDLGTLLEDMPFDLHGDLDGVLGAEGGSVTIAGPDGVSVVDLGENGSVTVTTEDGEITIESTGDATVSDLSDVIGEFGSIFEGELGRFLEDGALDEFLENAPAFEDGAFELPAFEPIDPDAVQACIDEVLGS